MWVSEITCPEGKFKVKQKNYFRLKQNLDCRPKGRENDLLEEQQLVLYGWDAICLKNEVQIG